MARIAIAGGAGAVGRTFVEALSKTSHQVIVLSRSPRSSSPYPNVTYAQITYDSIPTLVEFLETNKIDTVLSSITMDSEATSTAQLNLIAAASASSATKRFIPSEYGVIPSPEVIKFDPYGRFLLENAKALEKTSLEYVRIPVGSFLDFWGLPHIPTTVNAFRWAFDFENGVAHIPGDGEARLSITYTQDIARFVLRLLDEKEGSWPKIGAVVGQDVSFNEVLKWAEEATGRKFTVSYDSLEKLEGGEVTSFGSGILAEIERVFGIMAIKGFILLPKGEVRLNERFPDIEVYTVEKMIKNVWGKA